MAGPERALPGDADHGRLRASHANRDGVINTLKSAYVLGFVTKDEFDARVGQTLAARTYAELAGVTTDLPALLVAAQPPPWRAPARATLRPVDRAIVGFALLAAVAFAAAIISDDGWLALGAVGSALASLFLVAAQMGTARRPQQPGGQLPGRIGAGSGTAAAGLAPQPPREIQRGRLGDVRPPSRRRRRPLLSC
jgi:hypothetical protein